MLWNEMDPAQVADLILAQERKYNIWFSPSHMSDEQFEEAKKCMKEFITFQRSAKITSVEYRANRGRRAGNIPSTKYPGVFAHQIVKISDGKKTLEFSEPEQIGSWHATHENPEKQFYFRTPMLGFWKIDGGIHGNNELLQAAPQIIEMHREYLNMRLDFTQEKADELCDDYIKKNTSRVKPQIVKKLGSFLAEYDLKDENPELLLMIMKFVSRDNFWEMKKFLNYCRSNSGDINFLTPDDVTESQNLAKALEIQKS